MIINISNTKISQEKLSKLEKTHEPSSVMSIWEKIKDWFGFSQERKILTLIDNVYFNKDATIVEKNRDFFNLKKLAGEQYKNNFKFMISDDNNIVSYLIDFKDGLFKHDNDIKPFFETIKNELSLDLKNYSNEDLESFINNYSKLSLLKNDKKYFEEKFIAFRAILMECINSKKNSNENTFSSDEFKEITSLRDKYEYLEKNSKKYVVGINDEKLINDIYDSANQHDYEKLRSQVEKDIPRYTLNYNDEKIADIVTLEGKLKSLNNKDTMIIFELLNQGIFPIIKNSFNQYEFISSMYSPFTGSTSVNIENKGDFFTICVNNKKEVIESDLENISYLSDFILNDFDCDSMNLYIKSFVDGSISMEKITTALAQYETEINKRMEDSIGDKFNYQKSRSLLLEENINIKFEFNPHLMKKLTLSTQESKIEYSLLKS